MRDTGTGHCNNIVGITWVYIYIHLYIYIDIHIYIRVYMRVCIDYVCIELPNYLRTKFLLCLVRQYLGWPWDCISGFAMAAAQVII